MATTTTPRRLASAASKLKGAGSTAVLIPTPPPASWPPKAKARSDTAKAAIERKQAPSSPSVRNRPKL
jgi:hypothetical protein